MWQDFNILTSLIFLMFHQNPKTITQPCKGHILFSCNLILLLLLSATKTQIINLFLQQKLNLKGSNRKAQRKLELPPYTRQLHQITEETV